MDKHRRNEIKMLKYKKRLKNLNLDDKNPNTNYHCYKTTGNPCSCFSCSSDKYSRKIKHKNLYPIYDELYFLKNYTQEQINKMWNDCYPKFINYDTSKLIITKTFKN